MENNKLIIKEPISSLFYSYSKEYVIFIHDLIKATAISWCI